MQWSRPLFKKMSPMQLEVTRLYREFLRAVAKKDDLQTRQSLQKYIRAEFDKGRGIPRNKFDAIEWKIEYGRLQLEKVLKMKSDIMFSYYEPERAD
mmetsp:Transcript_35558/g.59657  ORF Transcript_35558/g.59657 Transcript_35558/m.59657 type:complete len:96 (-) Transcript_35558:366-653(-)